LDGGTLEMKEEKFASFTAADQFPEKLAQDYSVIRSIKKYNNIPPVHIQVCPTNKCTRDCSFCSCSEREKGITLPFDKLKKIINTFKSLGTKAITITGGGDPLCYPEINELISFLVEKEIKIGLVTNGDLISRLSIESLSSIVWCRISCSDEVNYNQKWISQVKQAIDKSKNLDWSFSYVLSFNPNYENIKKYVSFANRNKFSHIRIVSDLLHHDAVPDLEDTEEGKKIINNPLVLYQKRKTPVKGTKGCYISLLKPVIDASGNLFPCCGAQYALKKQTRNFSSEMGMGLDIKHIWSNQINFNGSVCEYCYYSDYNNFLSRLLIPLKHKEFI
jgi:organic radical activating enzyme